MRLLLLRSSGALVLALMVGCTREQAPELAPYLVTASPLRIVSANDGAALDLVGQSDANVPDSITVVDLFPDRPPVTRTVSGTVPNSISGAPYSAVLDSRYAFIPSHSFGAEDDPTAPTRVSVVDLDTPGLDVVAILAVPAHPWQALVHPDGESVIVLTDHEFHVFRFVSGQVRRVAKSEPFPFSLVSFAISPDAKTIVATVTRTEISVSADFELHLFELDGDSVRHVTRIGIEPGTGPTDQPFAPRFSPDGSRVLVLNGLGRAYAPPLDAVLSIDMTLDSPRVTERVSNVAQGLESVAFHPSGRFAVISCVDGPFVGHLAVIDLAASPMRLIAYYPVAFFPEGIEFSPDGSQLFVQASGAHHIAVYAVDGMRLVRSPFVLHTGEGPASLALGPLPLPGGG